MTIIDYRTVPFDGTDQIDTSVLANASGIMKTATVTYDFAVDGGTIGTITLATNFTFPSGAVVWCENTYMATTLASATDNAVISLTFPVDGDLITNYLITGTPTLMFPNTFGYQGVVLTASRTLDIVIAAEDITAGKITFVLKYWIP